MTEVTGATGMQIGSTYPTITPSAVPGIALAHAEAGDALYLHGPSGTGKSDVLAALCFDTGTKEMAWGQWAAATGKALPSPLPDLELVHLVLPQLSAEDFVGVPFHRRMADENGLENRITVCAPMDYFMGDAPKVLFLDEVSAAEIRTMKVLLQIINERKIAGKKMVPGTVVVMAGNRAEDRAAVKQVPFTLGNRAAHYEMVVSAEDWLAWARDKDVPGPFLAYVYQHGENALHNYKQNSSSLAQLTPRSFFKAALAWDNYRRRRLAQTKDGVLTEADQEWLDAIVLSKIGSEDGIKLNNFLKLRDQLPSWEEIVQNPDKAKLPLPGDLSTMYYLMGLFIDRLSRRDIADAELVPVVRYWDRAVAGSSDTVDASAWVIDSVFVRRKESEGVTEPGKFGMPKGKAKGNPEMNFRFRLAQEIVKYPLLKGKLQHFIASAQESRVWAQ